MKIIKNILAIISFGLFFLLAYWSITVMNEVENLIHEQTSGLAKANAYNEGVTTLYKMTSELNNKNNILDTSSLKFYEEALWYFEICNQDFNSKDQKLIELNDNLNTALAEMNAILDSSETKIVDIGEVLNITQKIEKNAFEIEGLILNYNNSESEVFKITTTNKMKIVPVCIFGFLVFIAIMIVINLKVK